MKTRRVSGAEGSHSGIDLAPMLDFVMNLLVFFIITAVFAKEVGIEVSRPGSGASSDTGKESKSMIVTIYGTGDIEIEGRMVDARAVRANVERMHALKPENGVMVVADAKAGTGILVEVVDQVRQGGVTNVSFGATH